jgi:hypothetical protein
LGDLLLVALFLGMVLWVGWPVTLWVVCASVLAWGARAAVRRYGAGAGARAAADTLLGVASGLGVVWLVQVALTGTGTFAGVETVRNTESWMAARSVDLQRLTHPGVFVVLNALALLIARTASGTRRAGRARPWASRAVAVVASMLFFGGLAERSGEARWITSRRSEGGDRVRAVHASQTRMVAMATARRRLARLRGEEVAYLATFLRSTQSKKHGAEIVAEKADHLAAHLGEPPAPAVSAASTPEWAAVQRWEAWLRVAGDGDPAPRPSVDDLDRLTRVALDLAEREAEARSSTDAFAVVVADALAKRWPDQAWGAAVRDFESARGVVASRGAQDEGGYVLTHLDGGEAAAVAEVDASELALEVRDRGDAEPDWLHPYVP